MRNGDCVRQRIACVHRLRNRICIDVSEYLFFLHFLRINSIRTQPISVNPDEPLRPKLVYNQDLVLSSLLSMVWGESPHWPQSPCGGRSRCQSHKFNMNNRRTNHQPSFTERYAEPGPPP